MRRIKNKEIKYCENCGIEIRNKGNKKVCSLKCSATLTSRRKYEKYIESWKLGIVSGGKGDSEGHGTVSNHVRKYLFEKLMISDIYKLINISQLKTTKK